MESMGLQVLEHCLVDSEHALADWAPQTWSIPLLDCWLGAMHSELAWQLARRETADAAQQHGAALVTWLDSMVCQLKGPGLNQVTRPVATKLQAVTKQINKMLKEPGSCQAVKHAKHKTLQQLLQAIQHSAAQKHPVLQHAGNTSTAINTSSSTIGRLSPFLTDIREQLSDSTVRDNQLEAFDAVRSYFTGSNSDRPAQHQLQQVTCATYNAFCELRSGVCDQILSLNGGSSSGRDPCSPDPGSRSSPDSQQQLDQCTRWLEAFAAAWKAEQEVLGEASDWNNVAAGVVEPTGTGKTGIMHLLPFAVLGGEAAPADMPQKVLLVTPNLVIRNGVLDSFTKPGKVCLRDVLGVTSDLNLLPTAFDLSTVPGMNDSAASATVAGVSSGDNLKVGAGAASSSSSSSSRSRNNAAAAVAAAAAIGFGDDVDDQEEGYGLDADHDMGSDDEDLMNNNSMLLTVKAENEDAPSSMQLSRSMNGSEAQPHRLSPTLQKLAGSDVVVSNIQQLPLKKLEVLFPRDYFGVVLVDEGHHAVARIWATVLDYFASAAKVLLTATPYRGDRADVPMQVVTGDSLDLKIAQRVRQGFCSNVAYAPVPVDAVTILPEGSHCEHTYTNPQDILELGERKDIQRAAMEHPEVRQSTMRHSLKLMEHLRSLSGQGHTVIGQALDKYDAEVLAEEWQVLVNQEFDGKYKVGYTHCSLPESKQAEVKAAAMSADLDVVIHVGQLGEGFDAPALSVVAVFKVFRSMAPFAQLLGRAVRRTKGVPTQHPANVAYLVAHPLLGYYKHWHIYCEERQDKPRELCGRGSVSNITVVNCQVSSSLTRDVQYLVDPAEIAAGDLKSPKATAAAGVVNIQVTAGSASSSAAAAAAVPLAVPAAAAAEVYDQLQLAQQDLQQLDGATLKQLREIISKHPCLSKITTSGTGRSKEAIANDIRQQLQALLAGGGVPAQPQVTMQLQQLSQLRVQAAAAGTTLMDLRDIKEKLKSHLSHIATSGAGRTTEVVRRDIVAAINLLMDRQGV